MPVRNPPASIFHLAIPCADLAEAERFYGGSLGCRIARRYGDRITLEFFGAQIVCHLSPDAVEKNPKPYPRHFGMTFRERSEFDAIVRRIDAAGISYFAAPSSRYAGKTEEHLTLMILDPSNNVLEFKHYLDSAMMY